MFPKPPVALPDKEPAAEVPEHVSDREFDFDSIDSSIVKDYTYEELSERAGMISFAKGFAVPDNPGTRKIKSFLDDKDLVAVLGGKKEPGKEEEARRSCLEAADLIIGSSLFSEKVLWQFYFLAPLVMSLNADMTFCRQLEMKINKREFDPRTVIAISNAAPNHPRVYISKKDNTGREIARIDILSKVPFRYKAGEYPDFDKIMKKENPEEVKKLVKFLETIPVNIYGLLMPVFPPSYKNRLQDSGTAFNIIMTAPYCRDMKDNRLLWKLFFRGTLISPIIHKQDLHIAITKRTMDTKIPREILKVIKKEMSYSETVFVKRKKEDKDWYYLKIQKNNFLRHYRSG